MPDHYWSRCAQGTGPKARRRKLRDRDRIHRQEKHRERRLAIQQAMRDGGTP